MQLCEEPGGKHVNCRLFLWSTVKQGKGGSYRRGVCSGSFAARFKLDLLDGVLYEVSNLAKIGALSQMRFLSSLRLLDCETGFLIVLK